TAYVNYMAAINAVKVGAYKGNGVVEVGRNVATQSGNFNGKVDQFRIWNAVRSLAAIQGNSTTQLSGNELNLVAYYEMEEAKGTATEDKARGANLVMKGASWALPEGRSAEFDGASYVSMNTGAAVVSSAMDFTLEFWFNAQPGAKNQTILSNGNGIDGKGEDPSKVFSVGFNEEGDLTFRHNGNTVVVDGKYADNNWHNFTLAVNRSSGIARIYMDGELNTYFAAEQVESIASDRMFAGARVWQEVRDTLDRTIDQYFTGKVDEVRLWNLYRQQSQIESFYNQKSNGDEMGLLLYYPFEHYVNVQGRSEMQFTLDDKGNDAVDASGKKLTFATIEGNVSESVNIPPVKTKGATASLLFDWVVNNDALIINLQETDYRIEKTIVNFTVNKVQDVNGNYILSPITWSAYIDRNQLKWMDDALTINKKENEPYAFEMPIVNKGGSVINYSLKDMPSWLSASSESGVINPLEKQTIQFEIDPSLAVGTYDEVVYLTNSNNVTEPLALNVTVEGNTPDWNVDPNKYEYSMAVFAQIKVDGQFSKDTNDMLAAFYNGECVGVAHMSYDKTLDMWYALLTVYSDKSSTHELTYRIWDASKGLMSEASAFTNVKFDDNKVYGEPTSPIVFSNGTVKYQNIQLKKGWNWVSFNLASENMSDIDTYLQGGNWNANSIVKNLSNKSANYSAVKNQWVNTGVVLNNTNMFKIHSDEEQTLSVSGSEVKLDSVEISLNKSGWSYISYLPNYSMSLNAALAGYEAVEGDVIKSNEGFAMYHGNDWIGSLKSLQPNCGYMMKNTSGSEKKFKYPTAATTLRSAAVAANASAYESNMSIIAYAPEKKDGDFLRALVGNTENEVVEVDLTDAYALQFINVSANAGDAVRFTLERDGVTYVAENAMTFAGDEVYGTPKNPYVLNFNIDGAESLSVYPNPVVDVLNVAGALNGEGDAEIELFDVTGTLVYATRLAATDNVLDANINMNGFASGSYLLKVSQNGDSKMFKIVKK
ncbi:MAG: T9SS type A sorting domain-containing protein, partial [Paludibacteraceae bacterium]|nr:T9SS type A sorting domain-containing protein [Paludibacteraceae bacterium]